MTYTVCQPDCRTDRDCVLGLWRRNLPEASADRYGWLYETGRASGLLLRDGDGRVVGSTGLMRRTLHACGQVLSAGQAIDLNVDADHRTVGPALGLQRAVTAAVGRGEIDLVYGFPNRQSEAVLRRIGYQVLGEVGRWVKPLSCRVALQRRSWFRPLQKYFTPLGDTLLRWGSRERFFPRPPGVSIEMVERFDARFDRLWQAAAGQFPVIGQRTAEYLNWRFDSCPDVRHRVLCLLDARGELLAYLVFRRGENTLYVGDFLFRDPRWLEVLLAEFLRLARRERAEAAVVVYLGSSQVCQALGQFGFWQRPSDWKAMIYADPQRPTHEVERLLTVENWHITRADLDTDE